MALREDANISLRLKLVPAAEFELGIYPLCAATKASAH